MVIAVGDPFEIPIPARHGLDRELAYSNSNHLLAAQRGKFDTSTTPPL